MVNLRNSYVEMIEYYLFMQWTYFEGLLWHQAFRDGTISVLRREDGQGDRWFQINVKSAVIEVSQWGRDHEGPRAYGMWEGREVLLGPCLRYWVDSRAFRKCQAKVCLQEDDGCDLDLSCFAPTPLRRTKCGLGFLLPSQLNESNGKHLE